MDTPPPGIEVAPGVRIAPGDLDFSFSRSGGPGGQNVNKVSTKVELRFRPEKLIG
ncbi:MAG TPA: peptide chain release factor-like protein, partial [Planctomycetota bacterium]|nr:peptide chain release factor-like protein [Planctomycetota bacterium]